MGLAACLHDRDSQHRGSTPNITRHKERKRLLQLLGISHSEMLADLVIDFCFVFVCVFSVKIDKDKQLVILEEEHEVSFFFFFLNFPPLNGSFSLVLIIKFTMLKIFTFLKQFFSFRIFHLML